MPEFDVRVIPTLQDLALQWAATILLFIVLKRKLFAPVSKILADRREKVQSELKDASNKQEEAKKLKQEYEVKIEEARKDAQKIVEMGRKRGDEVRAEIIKEARNEAENIKIRTYKEMESEKEKAVEELKSEVVSIAMMAASKVVERDLDENAHKEMINKFIDEVGESRWQN